MKEIRLTGEKVSVEPGHLLERGDVSRVYTPQKDGELRVFASDGKLLLHAIPRALTEEQTQRALYPLARTLRWKSINRGYAAGTKRVRMPNKDGSVPKISKAVSVASVAAGFMEPDAKRTPFCRATSYVAHEVKAWAEVLQLAQDVARVYAEKEPEFSEWQYEAARATHPAWVIPGTPFSTVTINVNFRTSTHTDKGDVCGPGRGLSNLLVVTRGEPKGGALLFPEHDCGVQLLDGDLILMDAHEMHCNTSLSGGLKSVRGSFVFYLRENLRHCGSPAEEIKKGQRVWRP